MVEYSQIREANENLLKIDVKGKGYVQVTERVKAFRSLWPEGTIKTEILSMEGETVVMQATIKDGEKVLATGMAYEKESTSYINRTSYIENCETSAVGRALGFLGIGIDASMASAEEVANAIMQQEVIKEAEALAKKCLEDTRKATGDQTISKEKAEALAKKCLDEGISIPKLLEAYKAESIACLNERQHAQIIKYWEKVKANCGSTGEA